MKHIVTLLTTAVILLLLATPFTAGAQPAGKVYRMGYIQTAHRLPTVFHAREFVEIGGLMSYGASLAYQFRRASVYVDKILKGAKPGDLPVEQATKFEFVINLKTAKALGLTIPSYLRLQADHILE